MTMTVHKSELIFDENCVRDEKRSFNSIVTRCFTDCLWQNLAESIAAHSCNDNRLCGIAANLYLRSAPEER